MATECGITGGLDLTCQTLKEAAGGLQQRIWIGNLGDLDSPGWTEVGAGYVESLEFLASYANLYTFTGVKNQNSTNSDAQRLDSGNATFPQSVVMTVHTTTPEQLNVLDELAYATVFAIVETSGNRLEVFGLNLGLGLESAPKTSGNGPADSSARIITLSGDQTEPEKVFLRTDYATSIAYLNSFVA